MAKKIANRDSAKKTANKKPFEGSNLFAEKANGVYVVYSYNRNWPLYIFKDGQWYGNNTHCSKSTTTHKNQAMPCAENEITWMSVIGLRKLKY